MKTTLRLRLGFANSFAAATSRQGMLTSEVSRMCSHPKSEPIRSAISSPVSVGGLTPYASPDGPTIAPCGPGAVRANLSPRAAKKLGLLMSGTYGPHGIGSSASVALALSLANKYRQRTAALGGILYRLTWRGWDTPAGRLIPALRASAPPTSDNGYIGWQTPRARGDGGGQRWRRNYTKSSQNLNLEDTVRIFCVERGKTEEEVARISLRPTFVRRLMGFPVEWDSCGAMAMQSFRRKPRNSLGHT